MRALLLTLALGLLPAAPALAGRSCQTRPPSVQAVTHGLQLAERAHAALEAEFAREGTRAVVLARAGQDLTRWGLQWSHLGIAVRDEAGRWRVLHKLNACGTAHASLYRQGLAEFFLDDPWRYRAAYAVPSRDAQQRVLAWAAQPARVTALHRRPYSLVSYTWGQRYQQSNQWAVESLAAALGPGIDSRDAAQAWLMAQGFTPTVLHVDAVTRLGGRLSQANVAFDDHPDRDRFAGRIATTTADGVFQWLARSGWAAPPVVLGLPS